MLITWEGQIASHSLQAMHLQLNGKESLYLSSPLGYLRRQCSPLILGEIVTFSWGKFMVSFSLHMDTTENQIPRNISLRKRYWQERSRTTDESKETTTTLAPGSAGINLLSVELNSYKMTLGIWKRTGRSKRREATHSTSVHQLCRLRSQSREMRLLLIIERRTTACSTKLAGIMAKTRKMQNRGYFVIRFGLNPRWIQLDVGILTSKHQVIDEYDTGNGVWSFCECVSK